MIEDKIHEQETETRCRIVSRDGISIARTCINKTEDKIHEFKIHFKWYQYHSNLQSNEILIHKQNREARIKIQKFKFRFGTQPNPHIIYHSSSFNEQIEILQQKYVNNNLVKETQKEKEKSRANYKV